MKDKKYVVLKINEELEDASLKERASGNWKLKLETVEDAIDLIVLHKQKIIKEYVILSSFKSEEDGRIRFKLTEKNLSYFLGKNLDYTTSNPSTTLMESEILKKIMFD